MISLKNLSFSYHKREKLFSNINLELGKGRICGLLGKNGAGKTSLLKVLAGLIFPTKASYCQVLNFTPQLRQPDFLAELYWVPEEVSVPTLTGQQFKKLYAPFYPRFNATLFQDMLCEFHLPNNKLLTELSHGEKKKFLLAFGLATDCRLLLLDEPTNGLDIPSKNEFRKLLIANITSDKSFIISTHQVHDVEHLIDYLVVLDNGEIALQQSIETIQQKLAFVQCPSVPQQSFYSEKNLSGYAAVVTNTNDQDTPLNLELLFNAVLTNKEALTKLFS